MKDNEIEQSNQLKQLLAKDATPYDPDQSLRRVLAHANQQTATKDVMGFFVSWVWVLFAGFGASMHQAYVKQQYQAQSQSGQVSNSNRVNSSKLKPGE